MNITQADRRRNVFARAVDSVPLSAAMVSPNLDKFAEGVLKLVQMGDGPEALQAWTDAGCILAGNGSAAVAEPGLNGRTRIDVFAENMEHGLNARINPHNALAVIQSMQTPAQAPGTVLYLETRAGVLSDVLAGQLQMQGQAQQAERAAGSDFQID